MPRYTLFKQHQAGIFTPDQCADGNIGTTHVGPCIAFYLYHPRTKRCLAMHLDVFTSFNVTSNTVLEFAPKCREEGLEGYHAYLVGGWPQCSDLTDTMAYEVRLPAMLKALGATVEEHLFKHDQAALDFSPEGFYDFVGFDLNAGRLLIRNLKGHDFVPVDASPEEIDLYHRSEAYASSGGSWRISMMLKKMIEHNFLQKDKRTPAVNAFLNKMIQSKDGTPYIPVHLMREQAEEQQIALIKAVQAKDAVNVMELLFTHFVDPSTPVARAQMWTPLHYACSLLNKEPDNFALKVIVLVLIMQGKIDYKITKKSKETPDKVVELFAIDMLNAPALKEFKTWCEKLLKLYAVKSVRYKVCRDKDLKGRIENDLVMGDLVPLHRTIMLLLAEAVIDYPTMSAADKKATEAALEERINICFPDFVKSAPTASESRLTSKSAAAAPKHRVSLS